MLTLLLAELSIAQVNRYGAAYRYWVADWTLQSRRRQCCCSSITKGDCKACACLDPTLPSTSYKASIVIGISSMLVKGFKGSAYSTS